MTRRSEQSMQALAKANRVRLARAGWLRSVRSAEQSEARRIVAAGIADPPAFLDTCPLAVALVAIPQVGKHKARQILADADVNWWREATGIGKLTDRERAALIEVLSRDESTRLAA